MAWRVATLRDAAGPIIWLNCICCMGVFEIPANRPRPFLTVTYLISMAIGYIILLYNLIKLIIEAFLFKQIMLYLVFAVNSLVAICSIILFWRNSQTINVVIKRCTIMDNTLDKFGVDRNYKEIFYNSLGCLSIWLFSMTLLDITHILWVWSEFDFKIVVYSTVCFCFPLTINSVIDVTFATFIRCIKLRLQKINNLISDMILSANEVFKTHNHRENKLTTVTGTNNRSKKEMIKHVVQTGRQLHLEITRIGQHINNAFCIQVLLEMAVHFTIILALFYNMYSAMSGYAGELKHHPEKIVALIIWGSIFPLKIILMNDLCTRASYEAYKTGEIIQTLDESFLDDDLREEIHQFTQQIIFNPLNFTAAGFFKINNAFTGKFFATITTYLVILIQFRAPPGI